MKIQYYQCNSNGNSFKIILHENNLDYSFFYIDKIKKICNYKKESSVDGLILLNYKKDLAFMDYYNNDGSWETFCLNGAICSSLVLKKKFKKDCFDIISNEIKYKTINHNDDIVEVQINKPVYKKRNIKINNYCGNYLDSGAKHLVINYNDDWDNKKELEKKMEKIRYDKIFSPDGINVNFYKQINLDTIQVKTYEKGIESLMDSCASGSFACAYDYSKNNNIKSVKIINDGGNSEILFSNNYQKNFFLSKGTIEFKGNIEV